MQQSPVTDKSLGVVISNEHKFREVRNKAKQDEHIRKTSRKKNTEPQPKFNIDDEVVVCIGLGSRGYCLVKVLDYEERCIGTFEYYAMVLKTTKKDMLARVGHLIKFEDSNGLFRMGWIYANVKNEGFRWL